MNSRTPPKKPSVGRKKPLGEALGSSPSAASQKQKVSGTFSDQSIEQLNDVTAVSGVNLLEEEAQLFSANKEHSRASEAIKRVVQEEEEGLILQKAPLEKKVAEIVAKCGLKNASNDVYKCLSLSVEEIMRSLISSMIRISKQRVDSEKSKSRQMSVVTSDIWQRIMTMNQKAKDEQDKKLAEAEKLPQVNEQPEGDHGAEVDKKKDKGRGKASKVNKEEDYKVRTAAANMAVRDAVGGDDVLSKWRLMAEQARQKQEGGQETASSSQPANKDGRSGGRKVGMNQVAGSQFRDVRSLSIKDLIAVMEREAQLSKTTLIYKLYEKSSSNLPPE